MVSLKLAVKALLVLGAVALLSAAAVLAAGQSGTNPHALPLGDGHVTTQGPKQGYVYVCQTSTAPGGASVNGPWIHGSSFDLTQKVTVDGRVAWGGAYVSMRSKDGRVVVSSDALPKGGYTGVFPISPSSKAYQYDRNPNAIKKTTIAWTLPRAKAAAKPSCLSGGPIGIALNGVPLFDGLDAGDRDAVAHEVQDKCGGHPQQQGEYHYHAIPACLLSSLHAKTNQASPLVGYALDGYPIYGPRGPGGKLYTNADLDACHGHTSTVSLNGKRVRIYHYQATLEYPYTLGCFHGTPLRLATPGGGPGGAPPTDPAMTPPYSGDPVPHQ